LEGLLANSHLLDPIVVFVLVPDLIDITSVSAAAAATTAAMSWQLRWQQQQQWQLRHLQHTRTL